MTNDLSIPEGQADRRRCAVSPTFATGKLNEPMAPKNENENTGGLNPRVRRTQDLSGASASGTKD